MSQHSGAWLRRRAECVQISPRVSLAALLCGGGVTNEPSTCYDGYGNAADSQQRDHDDHHEEQRPRRPTAPRTTRVHAAARALSSSTQRRTSASRWDAFSMRCLRASGNPHAAASRAIFVKTTSSSPTSPSSSTSSAWNPGAGPHLPRHHRVLQLHRRNPKRPAFRRGGATCVARAPVGAGHQGRPLFTSTCSSAAARRWLRFSVTAHRRPAPFYRRQHARHTATVYAYLVNV